ncbi:MAG TPA: GNAT family N-acetyltransferase [Gaiellaceae bacterium]|nr:GNAT family N-acetyltransferase [Gaiellaceae bacterium]
MSALEIVEVGADDPRLAAVRALFEEYATSLPFALDFQGFPDELAGLPGAYTPPRGRLLLAVAGGEAVGCVALRPHDARTAELKRLYVRPQARGSGAGRRLSKAAVAAARGAGYERVVLDTVPGMETAQALYRSLGFTDTAPYRFNPVEGASFLELRLRR